MNNLAIFCDKRLSKAIMDMLRCAEHKYTPLDLERSICSQCHAPAKTVRRTLKELIAQNRLAYTQFLGHTFVEISCKRAISAARGVILAPPDAAVDKASGKTVVRILPGAAFGMGDHATTRICLELMAWVFENQILPAPAASCRVMDIGTGSGVLAIAACLLGAGHAAGTDIDECARVEAAQNAALNDLENRVEIFNSVSRAKGINPGLFPFHLVLANLRYPTLAGMHDLVSEICAPGAAAIFSGFRPHERAGVLKAFAPEKFKLLRTFEANEWCGIAIKKKV